MFRTSIAFFNKTYSLLDVLPDIIKVEHLKQSPNSLTTALIEYLGKDRVDRLLNSENPIERRKLLSELKEKIATLVDKVNRGREAGTELLAIDLDRVDGLQITVITGDKWSFYRHLSDNTKFLFAYHLYASVYNLSGKILLFDEPNNGFHATAQELLLTFLRNLGTTGNMVIISTHSEHLIDPDHLTGVRLMTVDENGYLSIRNKWYAVTSGSGDFQALRPIHDAIGLRYGANHLIVAPELLKSQHGQELLQDQRKKALPHLCVSAEAHYPSPVILLMGSERQGLSSEQQALCDLIVSIPMHGSSDSLNVAVATAVVLYEILHKRLL